MVIGETSLGAQEVQELVQQLGSEYKGTSYHLLERNCNHFSNELCTKLTGRPAPSWVRSCRSQPRQMALLLMLQLHGNRKAAVNRSQPLSLMCCHAGHGC